MTALHRNQIGTDDPLRLDVAAALAYPDGSMGASGLRKEAARGNLVIERVAGRYYTTLAHIARMREKCRLAVKAPDFNCDRPVETSTDASPIPPHGALSTDDFSAAQAAAQMIVEELSGNLPPTSRKSTSRKPGGDNVIRPAFQSRTRSRSTGGR